MASSVQPEKIFCVNLSKSSVRGRTLETPGSHRSLGDLPVPLHPMKVSPQEKRSSQLPLKLRHIRGDRVPWAQCLALGSDEAVLMTPGLPWREPLRSHCSVSSPWVQNFPGHSSQTWQWSFTKIKMAELHSRLTQSLHLVVSGTFPEYFVSELLFAPPTRL